jgi:two-component system, OmpR family, osmolarity sensor histidine kinase EnvZ
MAVKTLQQTGPQRAGSPPRLPDYGEEKSHWLPRRLKALWRFSYTHVSNLFGDIMPKGLYGRALLIIIAPIVLLESVVAFTFMERHWSQVTERLSEATARDIAALVEIYEAYPLDRDFGKLIDIAQNKMGLSSLTVLPNGDLPSVQTKPFFGLLERKLTEQVRAQVKRPFWIDTVGRSGLVEIRVKANNAVLRVITPRSAIYASNSHIFLVWMVGTSVVLLTAAILLLHNQIRPIVKLAEAADSFGKGRGIPDDFKPRGAREVRQAATAFLEMRDRISQHVEQRTHMLAGVSHDLKTVLTRFKLELEFMPPSTDVEGMKADVIEMQQMLEEYLSFTRGDGGEQLAETNVRELLEEVVEDAAHFDAQIELNFPQRRRELVLPLKRHAMKRALMNLVANATRYGNTVQLRASIDRSKLQIDVEDDGPGIPAEERENVFKPFYRVDQSRTVDQGHVGLGMAIARDIAKSHGGDIVLERSALGGLQASIRVPL